MAVAGRRVEVRKTDTGWAATFGAMGSPCEVLLEEGAREAVRATAEVVAGEAWRIEDKFSRYLAGNIVHRINSADGATLEVDDETARLLDFATTLHELSDGRFDITSGVLREVWTFDGGNRLPSRAAVNEVLRHVGWRRARWSRPWLQLEPGMQIDLGGIGKEYAVDRCTAILARSGTGPGLVNFGGDLAVTAPPRRREAWIVAVEGRAADEADHVIRLRRGALATSGDARRFLESGGVRYSHILDPVTGWPVEGAPASVTVAADTCTQAGMLSTLAMLRGPGAEAFLEGEGVQFWCRRK